MIDPMELRALFDQAVILSPAARQVFLESACRHSLALRTEVNRLLAAHDRAGSAFDTDRFDETSESEVSEPGGTALAPGAQLGPYVITVALGAGGMGEVYKARDTRLDRSVAIKVLPPGVTSDPEARQRLEREARAAAALAHPHICTLLDIGRQDDVDYLVMEYLDGETLAERLTRGKLPVAEAVTYATQIAEALDTAHQAGIVHRDLKPGNVMLTKGGAKLLDFGLAKRRTCALAGDLATRASQPVTRAGVILGTVQYMAPEQLEGRPADDRTDIFAFGAMFYEMLTGRRAFEGLSDASLIGNILHAEPPPPSSVAPTTPRSLDELVRTCLAKDAKARPQSMAQVHAQLLSSQAMLSTGAGHGAHSRETSRAGGRKLIAIATVFALVATVALGWRALTRPAKASRTPEQPGVQRNLTRLTFDDGLQTDPTFSPDGHFLAYSSDRSGNLDIWVQSVAGGSAVQVTKSPAPDIQPSWSPDGSTIVFRSERDGGGLYVVPALGGPERRLVDFGVHPSWSRDGTEVRFRTHMHDPAAMSLYAVTLDGNAPHEVMPAFAASGRWKWIDAHPDGRFSFLGLHNTRGFGLYTVSEDGTVTDSHLVEHVTGPLSDLVHSGGQRFQWNGRGSALLLEAETNTGVKNLWSVRVDPVTLAWESVQRLTTSAGRDMAAALSRDGARLAFSTQRDSSRLWRFARDRIARVADGRPVTGEGSGVVGSEVATDGTTAVHTFMRAGFAGPARGLGMLGVSVTRLHSGRSELVIDNAQSAVWSPDQQRIAYTKLRPDTIDPRTGSQLTALAVARPTGDEQLISPWNRESHVVGVVNDWLPDGRAVLVCDGTRLMIWPISNPPAGAPARIVMAAQNTSVRQAKYSPDGRWLGLIIRTPVRRGDSMLAVTSAEGSPDRAPTLVAPRHRWVYGLRWARDGKSLYFLTSPSGAFIDVWGISFDPERGRPIGEPYAVTQFESPAFSISPSVIWWPTLNVTDRDLFLTMQSAAGNIWMLDNVDR